jgi:hypothetical protein
VFCSVWSELWVDLTSGVFETGHLTGDVGKWQKESVHVFRKAVLQIRRTTRAVKVKVVLVSRGRYHCMHYDINMYSYCKCVYKHSHLLTLSLSLSLSLSKCVLLTTLWILSQPNLNKQRHFNAATKHSHRDNTNLFTQLTKTWQIWCKLLCAVRKWQTETTYKPKRHTNRNDMHTETTCKPKRHANRNDMQTETTYKPKRHANRNDMHTETTCIPKRHANRNDMHTETTYKPKWHEYRNDMQTETTCKPKRHAYRNWEQNELKTNAIRTFLSFRDFRLSQRCCWRLKSSGVWRRVG